MKIQKFYYSERKAIWEAVLEKVEKRLEIQTYALEELLEEEQEKICNKQIEAVVERLSQLLPLPGEVCTLVNPSKYNRFLELANASIAFAEDRIVNLLVQTEGLTGCISFAAEELTCLTEQKNLFKELVDAADEIHIATSVDMGESSPTDIDGGVRVEFWFDFFIQVEME